MTEVHPDQLPLFRGPYYFSPTPGVVDLVMYETWKDIAEMDQAVCRYCLSRCTSSEECVETANEQE